MLQGKTVLLGVTGGIAAYKAAALASALVKQHCQVEVVMTEHATKFVTPLTFEQLTGRRTMVDTFDRNFSHQVEHIALAQRTDLVLIAPATANVCAKLAHGLADDMLTTTVLACKCPKLIAPAMNTNMYENPVTQDNLDILRRYGWEVIAPASGRLACGAVGAGKMPEPEDLLQHVLRQLACPHDLEGKHVLVTAGPTQESLDPVRYLTNHSTGKMGYAIARMAMLRGAQVTLVTGPTAIAPPPFVDVVPVVSAQDMFEAVAAHSPNADMIFKAAAVADYTPIGYSNDKVKKKDGDLSIPLKRTTDILQYLGQHRCHRPQHHLDDVAPLVIILQRDSKHRQQSDDHQRSNQQRVTQHPLCLFLQPYTPAPCRCRKSQSEKRGTQHGIHYFLSPFLRRSISSCTVHPVTR